MFFLFFIFCGGSDFCVDMRAPVAGKRPPSSKYSLFAGMCFDL